jgi:hypothetical protein
MLKENSICYFAYGSNMSTKRLQKRIPDAKFIGVASLKDFQFACNKKSNSVSGKGNIFPNKNACIWGVVFQLPHDAILNLDGVEIGYERITVQVLCNNKSLDCETYISQEITSELPFDWYLDYIIKGAKEHRLPEEYIHMLTQIPVKADA